MSKLENSASKGLKVCGTYICPIGRQQSLFRIFLGTKVKVREKYYAILELLFENF